MREYQRDLSNRYALRAPPRAAQSAPPYKRFRPAQTRPAALTRPARCQILSLCVCRIMSDRRVASRVARPPSTTGVEVLDVDGPRPKFFSDARLVRTLQPLALGDRTRAAARLPPLPFSMPLAERLSSWPMKRT